VDTPSRTSVGIACTAPSGLKPVGPSLLAVCTVLLLVFILPPAVHAQDGAPNPSDVDSGKVLPLNLKPGCWQVRTHTSTVVKTPENLPATATPPPPKRPTVEEAMKQWLSTLTPEQHAHLTQAQIDQVRTIFKASLEQPANGPTPAELQKQQADWITKLLAKGGTTTDIICTDTPGIQQGKELYGTLPKECTRSIQVSGQTWSGHRECPPRVADYKRTDAENASETIVETGMTNASDAPMQLAFTKTTTITSKWVAEAVPHMPYSVPSTDLDGNRPRGPFAVATFDPYRLVAIIDGKKFIARNAYFLINAQTNAEAEEWGPNLAHVMQKTYVQKEIYFEALRLRARLKDPGRFPPGEDVPGIPDPFATPKCCVVPRPGVIDRDTPGHDSSATEEHRDAEYSLGEVNPQWDFYFSQAKTPREKQALLEQVEERYKITVLDPDFFAGTRRD